MINCEMEYNENGSTVAGFGNMKTVGDPDKNHFDRKVQLSKLEWAKERVRSEEVEMRDVVNLETFFCEVSCEAAQKNRLVARKR